MDAFDAGRIPRTLEVHLLGDLVEHNARQRKHKIVVWSVEETRQFYDVGVVFYSI